jgi:hypothetical protein
MEIGRRLRSCSIVAVAPFAFAYTVIPTVTPTVTATAMTTDTDREIGSGLSIVGMVGMVVADAFAGSAVPHSPVQELLCTCSFHPRSTFVEWLHSSCFSDRCSCSCFH